MRERSRQPASHGVLAAYRAAAARNALSGDDGTWLKVGQLLEHAALLPDAERGAHLAEAARSLRAVIGDAAWNAGHATDPAPPEPGLTLASRIRTYCEIVEDAGALEVSDAILVAWLDADPAVTPIERARVESVRARLAWKGGDLDVASERYRRVASTARRIGSDELRVRALAGESVVARMRGNYPLSRTRGRRAVALAERVGHRRLASVAHHSLMVASAVGRSFDAAIAHAWQAYLFADGNATMQVAALGNLGQLFLDAGHPPIAIAAFNVVLRRRAPDRILLPALGGLAIAAARMERLDLVEDARRDIESRLDAGAIAYDTASVLLDLSRAYDIVGNAERAQVLRARAQTMAQAYGYHELEHHASAIVEPASRPRAPERRMPRGTEKVAEAIRELAGV